MREHTFDRFRTMGRLWAAWLVQILSEAVKGEINVLDNGLHGLCGVLIAGINDALPSVLAELVRSRHVAVDSSARLFFGKLGCILGARQVLVPGTLDLYKSVSIW